MKKKIKQGIKIAVFIVIFFFLLNIFTILFVRKGNGYGTDVFDFYKQKENSIDILYLGSSHAYSAFNPYLLEEETGLNGYVFATQQQPIWITYHYLVEALKYQQPQIVVLELHMAVVQDNEYAEEQVNRDAIDKMKMSNNKIKAINASVEKDKISYYFNIIKYHSRYKELNMIDIKTLLFNYSIDNKGYIGLPETEYVFEYNEKYNNETELQISEKNMIYLEKIIKLVKDKQIKLILVKTPAEYTIENRNKLNYLKKIANENEIPFYNYIENIEELKLDYNKDFHDNGHLNKNGSQKLSIEFSKIINNILDK